MYDRTTECWKQLHTPGSGLLSAWKKNKKLLTKEQDRVLDLFYNKKKSNRQIARLTGCSLGLASIQRNNALHVLRTGVPSKTYRRVDYPAVIQAREIVNKAEVNNKLSILILKKRYQDHQSTLQIARELNIPQMDVSILCNLSAHAKRS